MLNGCAKSVDKVGIRLVQVLGLYQLCTGLGFIGSFKRSVVNTIVILNIGFYKQFTQAMIKFSSLSLSLYTLSPRPTNTNKYIRNYL